MLEPNTKAYVNVLGYALNSLDFEVQIKDALKHMGLILLSLEDDEPYSVRVSEWEVSEKIAIKAIEVEQTGNLQFVTFNSYNIDDESLDT